MAGFILENPFFIPFLSVLIALSGLVLTFYYYKTTTKQKQIADNKADLVQVEQRAKDKQKEEVALAKEVASENKSTALEVKQEMKEYIINVINTLRHDIAIQNSNLEHEVDLMKQVDSQIQKDLMNYINEQTKINERIEKSLNFVSQFLWGQGAKSIPYYVTGQEEPQSHKDEPFEGLYLEPDSAETQAMKDHADSTGFASTISKEIEKAQERERHKQKAEPKNDFTDEQQQQIQEDKNKKEDKENNN